MYAYDPLPARRLAQHLKIQVISPADIPGIDESLLQCLLAEDAGWSALTLPIGEGKHVIIYNPTHAATRYESDVMHELAHLLLGHRPIHFHRLSGGLLVREYRVTDEEAAKYLGGCLQIPARGLDWAFQRDMTLQEIAEHFGASVQMVRYRCNMTGHDLSV
ncbi:MAG: ImmA/IrrE family metallo-endopeptidase [Ktedonobacteraceae bacterium]|nr:ImmA/IrrE family metallo-endopeptidase [Ktedonobacteraceae bacterium]